jgi:hypothetical protein
MVVGMCVVMGVRMLGVAAEEARMHKGLFSLFWRLPTGVKLCRGKKKKLFALLA